MAKVKQFAVHFILWLGGLAVAIALVWQFTYILRDLPELFSATGGALTVWMWIIRTIVAAVFLVAGYWLLFHPIMSRQAIGRLLVKIYRFFRPLKPVPEEIEPEPDEGPQTDPVAPPPPEKPRRPISRRRFLVEGTAMTVLTTDVFFLEPGNPTLNRVEIKLPNLPPAFNGLTIAHITDIHIDGLTPAESVARMVEQVNALKPDLTLVTGDFISHGNYYFDMAAETLGKLRDGAKLGVYGVSGNHDHWSDGEDLGRLAPLLAKNGLPLVRNTGTELKLNGDSLWLLGTDDSSTDNANLAKTMQAMGFRSKETAAKDPRPRLLMSHNPNFFPQTVGMGNTFMLSGHTHGSQVYMPGIVDVVMQPLFPRFRGYYRNNDLQLYVNSGFGTVGPPIRLLTHPEIALITLRSA